jgi:hypothetical protein
MYRKTQLTKHHIRLKLNQIDMEVDGYLVWPLVFKTSVAG